MTNDDAETSLRAGRTVLSCMQECRLQRKESIMQWQHVIVRAMFVAFLVTAIVSCLTGQEWW